MASPFFGIGMKTDLFHAVATAELSKFADILSIALSQHHHLGFEIAQLEFHHISNCSYRNLTEFFQWVSATLVYFFLNILGSVDTFFAVQS